MIKKLFLVFVFLLFSFGFVFAEEVFQGEGGNVFSGTSGGEFQTGGQEGIEGLVPSGLEPASQERIGGTDFSSGGSSYLFSNPQYSSPGIMRSSPEIFRYRAIDGSLDGRCEVGTAFLVQIAPGGCNPAVVRSDLLSERDVPVFCKLQATQINPFIDATLIRTISIHSRGQIPEGILNIGFHRPKSAIQGLGSSGTAETQGLFSSENAGYAVIILKRHPDERTMPDSISGNLTLSIRYDAINSFGMGNSEMILPILSDREWQSTYTKYGVLNGRMFLRLESISGDRARVGVYADANTRYSSINLEKGNVGDSNLLRNFVPGLDCRASYDLVYDGSQQPQTKARIFFDGDEYEVYQGSQFPEDSKLCQITSINHDGFGSGSVSGSCGNQKFNLFLDYYPVSLKVDNEVKKFKTGDIVKSTDKQLIRLGGYATHKKGDFVILINSSDISQSNEQLRRVEVFKKQYLSNSNLEGYDEFKVIYKGEEFGGIIFEGLEDLSDFNTGYKDVEGYFSRAIDFYKQVDNDYGSLKDLNNESYGKVALIEAIKLSETLGKIKTATELSKRLEENYGGGYYLSDINLNRERASSVVKVNDYEYMISLRSIDEPPFSSYGVRVNVGGQIKEVVTNDFLLDPGFAISGNNRIRLTRIDKDKIIVSAECFNQSRVNEEIELGYMKTICGVDVRVLNINYEEMAKISFKTRSDMNVQETNISYHIGIEKRAIELSPEKSLERIRRLNESIAKWESINEKLGTMVSTMKAACFATSAALQVKNLFSNMGGKAIARQEVMLGENGWNEICAEAMNRGGVPLDGMNMAPGPYNSEDDCIRRNADNIERDVSQMQVAIEQTNNRIKEMESEKELVHRGGLLGGSTVDTDKSLEYSLESVKADFGSNSKYGEDVRALSKDFVGYEELRQIETNLRVLESNPSESSRRVAEGNLERLFENFRKINQQSSLAENLRVNSGIIGTLNFANVETRNTPAQYFSGSVVESDTSVGGHNLGRGTPVTGVVFGGATYLASLQDLGGDSYIIQDVFKIDENGNLVEKVGDDVKSRISAQYPNFRKFSEASYNNRYLNPEVRYYETEPYKGMPAIVPIDLNRGWYAATKPTLPAFGAQGAFQESGMVSSFWLCNVGENGREQFNSGLGDDICQQFNLNTGQPMNQFPGLSEEESTKLVRDAVYFIQEASRQYRPGVSTINIRGLRLKVGDPSVSISGTKCTDFMSPKDCQLMFNVCDPVICPASRCNLGGKYHVSDVVQTGIIGGIFLCLPNFREGIYIPVCLTGIHAGIDNFVSILKASRDCLQENIDNGTYTGICDQLTAIYKCEFFWRQISPMLNNIIPRFLETITGRGGGTRGGGEYLSVRHAWENMQSSIDYFKNDYGVNAMNAFRLRSIEQAEIGTEFCKSFISLSYASDFKTLIEPDSPVQFSAWFNEIPHSDATVPARSHYKVYYHIFAGNDAGAYYSVYLKDAQGESFFIGSGIQVVDTGYVPVGEYVDESKDFIAPSNYKELCVRINGQDHCGFKQVSTSFALNYLRDTYAKNQMTETNIRTEQECISGTPNALPMLTPNIQAGMEESALPQIYKRGIIRVCSTANPGSGTNPDRWVQVGICGSSNIGCWLDSESVDRAITPGHEGMRDATIEELEELIRQKEIEELSQRIDPAELIGVLNELRRNISNMQEMDLERMKREANVLMVQLDEVQKELFVFETQAAEIIFLKGKINDVVARKSYKEYELKKEVPEVDEPEVPTPEIPGEDEVMVKDCQKEFRFGPLNMRKLTIYWSDRMWLVDLDWIISNSEKELNLSSVLNRKDVPENIIDVLKNYQDKICKEGEVVKEGEIEGVVEISEIQDYVLAVAESLLGARGKEIHNQYCPTGDKAGGLSCFSVAVSIYNASGADKRCVFTNKQNVGCSNTRGQYELIPGDLLQIYVGDSSPTKEHNVIFKNWSNKENKIAWVYSFSGNSNDDLILHERDLSIQYVTIIWEPVKIGEPLIRLNVQSSYDLDGEILVEHDYFDLYDYYSDIGKWESIGDFNWVDGGRLITLDSQLKVVFNKSFFSSFDFEKDSLELYFSKGFSSLKINSDNLEIEFKGSDYLDYGVNHLHLLVNGEMLDGSFRSYRFREEPLIAGLPSFNAGEIHRDILACFGEDTLRTILVGAVVKNNPNCDIRMQNFPRVMELSKKMDIDFNFVAAVIHKESRWDERATSGSAFGLMQITRNAFAEVNIDGAQYCGDDFNKYVVENGFDRMSARDFPNVQARFFEPELNVFYGLCYFKIIEKKYRAPDFDYILSAYNLGITELRTNCGSGWRSGNYDGYCLPILKTELSKNRSPEFVSEKTNYVSRVRTNYQAYKNGNPLNFDIAVLS